MTGQELYHKYVNLRDCTGSKEDKYAQFLETLFLNIREDLYPLLEKAEKQSKRLALSDELIHLYLYSDTNFDEISVSDIVMV